ncbi:MAG: aminoacyl-tRNA hydrolase [Alphaproteobacteria bacterium]|nr:aminoacyl-tRNA hydrolase [Alphaproteobacteria bacterium]
MWLIAGLGNPGPEYARTRHNIGFMAIDALAGPAHFSSKFHGESASLSIEGEKIILLKPMTYMNHSGRAVQAAMAFYKIPPAQLIVIHDELDLPLGKLRIKQGGGANGHNGLKDIDACIGPDYWRIRLGIGHPGDKSRVHDHVLSRFGDAEMAQAGRVNAALAAQFPLFWQRSPEVLASKLALALAPPKPEKPVDTPPIAPKTE